MWSLLPRLFDLFLIFGPSLGFVSQLREIQHSRNADGYAWQVSAILLSCNTLRVVYFFGHRFNITLLVQAFVSISIHLVLLSTVLKLRLGQLYLRFAGVAPRTVNTGSFDSPDVRVKTGRDRLAEDVIADVAFYKTPRGFLTGYFVATLLAGLVTSQFVFAAYPNTIEAVGYVSLMAEATTILPQLYLNQVRRSTEGVTPLFVFVWIAGDVVKTVYFILERQPMPFIVCGYTQLALDLVFISQIVIFRFPPSSHGPKSATPTRGKSSLSRNSSVSTLPAFDRDAESPDAHLIPLPRLSREVKIGSLERDSFVLPPLP